MGKNDLDALLGENGYVLSVALYLFVHPEWRSGEKLFNNDIGIAVLQNTIQFTVFVKPICIWRKSRTYRDVIDREGMVAGWGKTETTSIMTSKAMYVKIPVVSNEECLRSDQRFFQILSEHSFCAGIKDSNEGPCKGDSGKTKFIFSLKRSFITFFCNLSTFYRRSFCCERAGWQNLLERHR